MKSHSAYGTAFLAFLLLQYATAWHGERKASAGVDLTLSLMADQLIQEEDLASALNHVLKKGEQAEVMSIKDISSILGESTAQGRTPQKGSGKRVGGRALLSAPAPADLHPVDGTPVSMRGDQQGTGQKPDNSASMDRLFTTAEFQSGDSILSHVGFGLQQPPQQTQPETNNGGRSALQSSASSVQPDSADAAQGSTKLWDASVAKAQQRGMPAASLYPDVAAALSPSASRPSVQTGFGLQKKPLRSSTDEPPITDEAIFADAPAAAVPVHTMSQGPAGGLPAAKIGQSLTTQIGIRLDKNPSKSSPAAAAPAPLPAAVAAAADSKPVAAMSAAAANGIKSLRTDQFRQQAQLAAEAVSDTPGGGAAAGAAIGAGSGPGAAGAPLSARRRGLAAWGDNVAEVKDDRWAREGWQGDERTGHAISGTGGGRRAKIGISAGSGVRAAADDADDEDFYMTSAVRGNADERKPLPLVARSSGGGWQPAGRRGSEQKKRRKPFQPDNESYLLDALAAVVKGDLQEDQSRRKELSREGVGEIVHLVTGHRQVRAEDSEEADSAGDSFDTAQEDRSAHPEDKPTQRNRMSVGELGGYITQLAAVHVNTRDSKVVERMQSHVFLAKLKQALTDMGILTGDVAVMPRFQEAAESSGSNSAVKLTKRGLLAAGKTLEHHQNSLPDSLVSAIQAAAGFVSLHLPSEVQTKSVVATA